MKKFGKYYVTIGLEIHVALNTKEKLFSHTQNSFSVDNFSLFDVGTPGILPILSKEPVEMASAFAIAVNASLEKYSEFERKHYFYPDLPLGYQITQQHKPILIGGIVPIKIKNLDKIEEKNIIIEHAHLECDAAKSIHDMYNEYTSIDISRCASPLLEIVSTPCMHAPLEAKEYAKEVYSLVTFLGICDGKMEEGSFRVDASISLNTEPNKLGTRVEIKNISSFGFLEAALNYEIDRQSELLSSGKNILMETRLFDEIKNETKSMREKETVDEYRYMPDPDILPLILDNDLIESVKEHYITDYFFIKNKIYNLYQSKKIEIDDGLFVQVLKKHSKIFSEIKNLDDNLISEKFLRMIAFWMPDIFWKNDFKKINLNDFITLEKSNLESKEIKETLSQFIQSEKSIVECIPQFIDNSEIEIIIKNILDKYPFQKNQFKEGEQKILQFLIGKVMTELKGKAPATLIKDKTLYYLNNN